MRRIHASVAVARAVDAVPLRQTPHRSRRAGARALRLVVGRLPGARDVAADRRHGRVDGIAAGAAHGHVGDGATAAAEFRRHADAVAAAIEHGDAIDRVATLAREVDAAAVPEHGIHHARGERTRDHVVRLAVERLVRRIERHHAQPLVAAPEVRAGGVLRAGEVGIRAVGAREHAVEHEHVLEADIGAVVDRHADVGVA